MISIDGYSDLERIGRGGLGDVYRGTRDSTGGTVAIKVLRDLSDESVAWHRTHRELTALVSLAGHAHVIQLLELLDLPEGPALVMEYAPGGSVADFIARRDATLSVPEAALVGRHTADALVAAHEQDIVHRDLKPQNLLIDAYGQIKLCDFGIASLARSDDFHTRTNALSLRYASPEDLDEDAEVGPASDVYSLGATLLHLVHGTPLAMKERLQPWTAPASDDAEQATLDALIADCLRADPDERPDTVALLDRLEALDRTLTDRCRGLPVEAPTAGPGVASPGTARVGRNAIRDEIDDEIGDDIADRKPAGPGAIAGTGAAVAAAAATPPPHAAGADEPSAPDVGDDAPALTSDTSSRTAQRADAIPARPAPPRPSADPARRRWPWVAAALTAAALLGVALAVVWPPADEVAAPVTSTDDLAAGDNTLSASDDAVDTGASDAATSAAAGIDVLARPPDLVAIDDPSIVWPFGDVGDCLVQVAGLDELMSVDCDEPHDLQRFAVAELDPVDFGDDAAYSAEAVQVTSDDACRQRFVEFVGVAASETDFRIAITRPSARSWADGDRRFQCFLGVPDHHVVGDAEGMNG